MYRVPLWPITVMDSRRVGDWQATGVPVVDVHELAAGKLAPALRGGAEQSIEAGGYGQTLVDECRHALSALLPFTDGERAFLDRLLDEGEIDATLLTDDPGLQQRIEAQPLLAWKAQHVRSHRTAL